MNAGSRSCQSRQVDLRPGVEQRHSARQAAWNVENERSTGPPPLDGVPSLAAARTPESSGKYPYFEGSPLFPFAPEPTNLQWAPTIRVAIPKSAAKSFVGRVRGLAREALENRHLMD